MSKNKKILIVEDNPLNIEIMADILTEYTKFVAISGKIAIDIAIEKSPDLILLDVIMPDLNGFEVCKILKSNELTKDIPVVFVTAKDNVDDESKGFEIGAIDYITKPISPPIVKARVKNILNYIDSKKELKENYITLQKSQNQLILNEKLVSLGNLVASIAHEINSPLGAIISSNNLIIDIFVSTTKIFLNNNPFISEIERIFIIDIIQNMLNNQTILTLKEKREIKNELVDEIESCIGNIDSDELSELLINSNIYKINDEIHSIIRSDNFSQIFNFLREISQIVDSIKIIKASSTQIEKIILALRSYSKNSRVESENKTIAYLHEGIETVLTIFNPKIKNDVEIIRNYDYDCKINCYPSQLIQVWTNIIQNSLQAMNYKGRLEIIIEKNDKFAIVKIIDNGGGIEESIKDRIFEPFFSTKDLGEGTGLGLDIVRNIILRHNGEIDFESNKSVGTTFIIKLPLNDN